MDPLLSSTLLKLAIPLATIAAVILFARRRGLDWRGELALRAPRPGPAALWLAAWIAWMALVEWAIVAWGVTTASLPVPIAMHALGNLLSIWQSTHG